MQIVSLDPGSSYMKATCDGTSPHRFPALVRPCAPDLPGAIRVDQKTYLVGERAQTAYNTAIEKPHIQPGYHGSQEHRIQICYSLEKLGVRGEQDLLVLSLPYSDHRRSELCTRLRTWRQFDWHAREGDDWKARQVKFREVLLVPQGVGALEVFHAKHQTQPPVVALVDLGSCTTDIVTIMLTDAGEYDYNYEACRSVENVNVSMFKDLWVSAIGQHVRGLPNTKRFDYWRLMGMAMRGDFNLQLGDKTENIEPAFKAARAQFLERVIHAVQDTLQDLDPNRIILTGGGAYLVDLTLWGDRRLERLDVWANVMGQYQAGKGMLKGKSPEAPAPAPVVVTEAAVSA